MKNKLLLGLFIYWLQLLVAPTVFAQQWAENMFEERRHSFGNVAIGVEAIHRFKFKNPYPEDVHIASVTSSCGCTTPYWPKSPIKFGETGEVTAQLNTDGRFKENKSATLTVVFDRPYRAEVQLQVTSYIRPDVVITPGVADFGTVPEGKQVTKKLTVQYAGQTDWKLIDIERTNPHIFVRADQIESRNGRVVYDITVMMRDTMPSGYVHDMIRFVTNDPNPNASTVMLPVHGFVAAPLVAKPSPFVVGFVQPGETVKKNLVLRSDSPFRITKITSRDQRFQFAVSDLEHSVHVLPIVFTADASLGYLNEPIIIHTTLPGQQKQMQLLTQGMVFDEHQWNFPKQMLAEKAAPEESEAAEIVEITVDAADEEPVAAEHHPSNDASREIGVPNPPPAPTEKVAMRIDLTPNASLHRQTSPAAQPQEKDGFSGVDHSLSPQTTKPTSPPTPPEIAETPSFFDAPQIVVANPPETVDAATVDASTVEHKESSPVFRLRDTTPPQSQSSDAVNVDPVKSPTNPPTKRLPTQPSMPSSTQTTSQAIVRPTTTKATNAETSDEWEASPAPGEMTTLTPPATKSRSVDVVTPSLSEVSEPASQPDFDDPSVPVFEIISEPVSDTPSTGVSTFGALTDTGTTNRPRESTNALGGMPIPSQDVPVYDDVRDANINRQPPVDDRPEMTDLAPTETRAQGLVFSKPSVKENLLLFSEAKSNTVDISEVFDIVGEAPNGNRVPRTEVAVGNAANQPPSNVPVLTNPQMEAAPRIARAVPVAESPKIPPVPGMKPTNVPQMAPPPLPNVPVDVAPPAAPSYVTPSETQAAPPSSVIASSPTTAAKPYEATDTRALITSLFGTSGDSIAEKPVFELAPPAERRQSPPLAQVQRDDLQPMELQPLVPGNYDSWGGSLSQIPGSDEEAEYLIADDDGVAIMQQPETMIPRIDTQQQRQRRAAVEGTIAGGAPIPMTLPQISPQRQNTQQNVASNMTPNRAGRSMPPSTAPQYANAGQQLTQQQLQQRAAMSRQQVQQQRLTPQQQQMQQQRMAAAGQAGRTTTATSLQSQNPAAQQNAIARAPQQLVLPPVPATQNSPMMPAPVFR